MAIITISRELAALGDETAKELARLLNFRFVDKRTLEERIKSYGITDEKLAKYDERKPSLFASISADRDEYLHYLKTAMLAEASAGPCVIMGRGAVALLGGVPGVLPVFLVSPLETRTARVKSYFHCDERRARLIIAQSDSDRAGFHKYFFEMDWKAPQNYLLTINTGFLNPATAAETIRQILDRVITSQTEAQTEKRLAEYILAQRIVHHVLYERKLAIHFFEASVEDNVVTLFGVANSQTLLDEAVEAAKNIAAEREIRPEIQIVQEYSLVA